MQIVIRPVLPGEHRTLGEITAQAYLRDGLLDFGEDDAYLDVLRDTAGRAAHAEVLVAARAAARSAAPAAPCGSPPSAGDGAPPAGARTARGWGAATPGAGRPGPPGAVGDVPGTVGDVLGGVTFVPCGGPMADLAGPGEAEIRMLAVSRAARGRGVGEALVRACVDRAGAVPGCVRVVLSTGPAMRTAHRVYERLGFVRTPGRDWNPLPEELPGLALLTYELTL